MGGHKLPGSCPHEVRSNFDEVDVEHEVAAWALETGVKDGLGKVGSDLESLWS